MASATFPLWREGWFILKMPLKMGLAYSQVAAGYAHTVLLRSDGTAVACGGNSYGQCRLPALEEGLVDSDVAARANHTVLLKSDGTAVACGRNSDGRCSLPALEEGLVYSQVACSRRGASRMLPSLHICCLRTYKPLLASMVDCQSRQPPWGTRRTVSDDDLKHVLSISAESANNAFFKQ